MNLDLTNTTSPQLAFGGFQAVCTANKPAVWYLSTCLLIALLPVASYTIII